ncbi:MAG: HK97 gp10 family phage protein [Chloroflexota bacterium]|nr:HK97 gp10 family phage protein [Chloroflexota bacterium]
MAMTYEVSIPQLPVLRESFSRGAGVATINATSRAINKSLVVMQSTAKQRVPVDSGRLRGSIQIDIAKRHGNVLQGSVYTNVQYAGWQEAGTGIYGPLKREITPKTKPYLKFKVGGRWVTTRSVKGVRPRWYFRSAVEENRGRVYGFFEEAAEEVVAHLARRGA